MRFDTWLCAAALILGLAVGCDEGESDDGDGDGPTSDGGGLNQDAAQGGAGGGGEAPSDAGANQDAAAGGGDASTDGGPSQDAAAAGSGGGGAGGTTGGTAGAAGGTVSPSRCPVRNLRNDLLGAFGNLNARICDVCFDEASTCQAAPFGGTAIECFIDVACNTPHLHDSAQCLTGALASEHGICNQGAEASCDDDCYLHALGKAVGRCNDPNLGAALSKCGFDLTI